jgi:hypothetical protein
MKNTLNQHLFNATKIVAAAFVVSGIFSSCTKSSATANTGPVLPAEAIRGTTLNGGNVKGVMLTDSTYTINGDITVLKGDTLSVQPGATINVPGNHAFYIQGTLLSLGTQQQPVVFQSPTALPGQWGGFQADSAQGITVKWTKILWAGGPDSTGGTRQTIGISTPIDVDIEDSWFIGGQDNSIGVYSTATVTILRNTFQGNGTTDGDCIDFHSGVTGTVAYNVLWGSAGSAIKVFTSATIKNPQTDVTVYNNTCIDNGFRRGAAEPGRGILVDAFSTGKFYNNLLVNNYYSLDITPTSEFSTVQYGNNYFYATVDSLVTNFYPVGSKGVPQTSDIISQTTGANDPMFVNYTPPPNPSLRIMPPAYDFHLKAGSPALGKGNPTYNNDIGAYTSDGKGNLH